jgi:hypothetical protein
MAFCAVTTTAPTVTTSAVLKLTAFVVTSSCPPMPVPEVPWNVVVPVPDCWF